jgi:biotin carboxyl carrier protein
MKYIALIGGEEYVIDIGAHGDLRINDASRAVHLESIDGASHFSLLVGPKSHDVFVERVGGGYAITVDGELYSVQVEGERAARADEQGSRGRPKREATAGPATGTQGAVPRDASAGAVTSPMTGVLVEILAGVGQAVEAGEGVAILEAMKTENVVRAPAGGSVKSIEASTGQSLRMDEVIMYLDLSEHTE